MLKILMLQSKIAELSHLLKFFVCFENSTCFPYVKTCKNFNLSKINLSNLNNILPVFST